MLRLAAIQEAVRLKPSNRLPGVDGLRAVAALWVVLFHVTALSHARFPQVPGLDLFLKSGSTGVSLFLVLSGFCLFLPFAGGRTARFKSGDFFKRRFRRLAPAYYTSLVLSVALLLVTSQPLGVPGLSFGDATWQLATHLTLAHSLFPDTFYALNGAYWSLGLEWQLYLGLPLLIFGMRRFGLWPVVGFAVGCNVVYRLALGLAINSGTIPAGSALAEYVLPNQLFGRWAEFAFGMLAAELYATHRLERLGRFVPLMLCGIVALVPVALLVTQYELSHIVYGLVFVTLLCLVLVGDNAVTRVMSWRPLVAIGTMSYSLYLIHQPVIQSVAAWFELYQPAASPRFVFFALLLVVVPVILLLAWVLFLAVERRTMGPASANVLNPPFDLRLPSLRLRRPVAVVKAVD
jgi:peptidoglycan/LPS O-acetylase OafA/YrhL